MATHGASRTSQNSPIRVDWIDAMPADVAGRLGLTIAPGKKGGSVYGAPWDRDLDADLAELRRIGCDVLVSLIEDAELGMYRIGPLFDRTAAHGIRSLRLPIVDVKVPDDIAAVHALVDEIDAAVRRGESVVVHCIGGLGRSGLIAGCCLMHWGAAPEEALRILVRSRKDAKCPETPEQREFVRRYTRPVAKAEVGWQEDRLLADLRGGVIQLRIASLPQRGRQNVEAEVASLEWAIRSAGEAAFEFDCEGFATLVAMGRRLGAGRFSTPTIGELRARASGSTAGRVRCSMIRGTGDATDIGALQAHAPESTLFQAASQFNALEAPGPYVVPVADYVHDSTQGPRAAISAVAGALLRHYCAPATGGGTFEQATHRCLDLLVDAVDPVVAKCRGGYLSTDHVQDMRALVAGLEERFESIRIGLHERVEVSFGHQWGGALPTGGANTIAQVYTSTMALGGYSQSGKAGAVDACRQLLRAAYLGTLLAGAATGHRRVVLTLIGGGVFGNPMREIFAAIEWSVAAFEAGPYGSLEVIVNGRDQVATSLDDLVRRTGGSIVEVA